MTIIGAYSRLNHMIDSIKVYYYSDSMLKELMKRTPFQDVRIRIWKRLGNKIGEDSYINNNIILIDSSGVRPNVILGERVALAPYVTFITDSAPNKSNLGTRADTAHFLKSGTITIDDDTWVGTNTVIHPGVSIGKNCIIGACSNVTSDIPDNVVAYGNPAKVVKRISNDL